MINKFLVQNPIISEKSTSGAADGKYSFRVARSANAIEVKKAVEQTYKVHVIKTNVINAKPKPKNFGQRTRMEPGYKKVIVTLKKGEKLDILPS